MKLHKRKSFLLSDRKKLGRDYLKFLYSFDEITQTKKSIEFDRNEKNKNIFVIT